jgi:hypothetical protein
MRIAARRTATVAPPATIAALFVSNFSTALGNTAAAVRDTGKALPWTSRAGSGWNVVASAGLDFPSANVLAMTAEQATAGLVRVSLTAALPAMAIGASRWYRWYERLVFTDGLTDPSAHICEDPSSGGRDWQHEIMHNLGGAGNYVAQAKTSNGVVNPNNTNFNPPATPKGATYRHEVQRTRVDGTHFHFHRRIYSSAGVLLYGDADFDNDSSGIANLGVDQTTLPSGIGFNQTNGSWGTGLDAGLNGVAGVDWFPAMLYGYLACFAISDVDWCGAYGHVTIGGVNETLL